MNSNVPFWCVTTFKNVIFKKLRESTLWMQLVKLICEKNKDLYYARLIVLAKEVTFLFSLVYFTKDEKIKKLSCRQYKKELFDAHCEDSDEMKSMLNSCDIYENSEKIFNIYLSIAKLISEILSNVAGERIHCSEIAFYMNYIIEKEGDFKYVVANDLLPKNIPAPPPNFLPSEWII